MEKSPVVNDSKPKKQMSPEEKWSNRKDEGEAFFNTMYPVADRYSEHLLKGRVPLEQMPTAQIQTTLSLLQTFMQLWVAMKLKNL